MLSIPQEKNYIHICASVSATRNLNGEDNCHIVDAFVAIAFGADFSDMS